MKLLVRNKYSVQSLFSNSPSQLLVALVMVICSAFPSEDRESGLTHGTDESPRSPRTFGFLRKPSRTRGTTHGTRGASHGSHGSHRPRVTSHVSHRPHGSTGHSHHG